MKKDILFPRVEGISIAIVRQSEDSWQVFFINDNEFPLDNVLISSRGYGEIEGESRQTSTLRHVFEMVDARSSVAVEPITPEVFGLNNEYWVSYYVGNTIYDKRFLFVPDSIVESNLTKIESLNQAEGILHG